MRASTVTRMPSARRLESALGARTVANALMPHSDAWRVKNSGPRRAAAWPAKVGLGWSVLRGGRCPASSPDVNATPRCQDRRARVRAAFLAAADLPAGPLV
jgi:hypothetical protein